MSINEALTQKIDLKIKQMHQEKKVEELKLQKQILVEQEKQRQQKITEIQKKKENKIRFALAQ